MIFGDKVLNNCRRVTYEEMLQQIVKDRDYIRDVAKHDWNPMNRGFYSGEEEAYETMIEHIKYKLSLIK